MKLNISIPLFILLFVGPTFSQDSVGLQIESSLEKVIQQKLTVGISGGAIKGDSEY